MDALHVRLGFSFSAGLFDYLINFGKATQPWLLLPVGIGYFGVYYAVFRFAIVRFDLKTPGREPPEELAPALVLAGDRPRARGLIEALGGAANLTSVDACTTRLRLVVADQGAVSEPALRALGALGVVRPSARDLQVVLGPIADEMAREMREVLASAPAVAVAIAATPLGARQQTNHGDPTLAAAILAALGGPGNVGRVEAASNRLLLTLADLGGVNEPALRGLGVRGVAHTAAKRVHLLMAGDAAGAAAAIGELVGG
jgi:PTS system N-acetylglucosamine-specific IIC component